MDNVISLSVGEPDFQTPWQIRKAGINSLERGKTKYTANKGYDKLLNEISLYLDRKYEKFLEFCRLEEESSRRLSSNIGEGCDANPEISIEIKESIPS